MARSILLSSFRFEASNCSSYYSLFLISKGKPVDSDNLRRIESIVNEQIKAELNVFSMEATLAEAKRFNGLGAVFGEVYPDLVRVVAIGQKVEDLLDDPENEKWSSISAELGGGTRISNTREAKAFALLSEEGIAKGICRITAVTTDSAKEAMELAEKIEQEVDDAAKTEGILLEERGSSLKNCVDSAAIPAARTADIRTKIARLQLIELKKAYILSDQLRKAQKQIAEENKRKAIQVTSEKADLAASNGKAFCISHVNVSLDVAAVREAVVKVMEQKGLSVMIFSKDEKTKKAVVCAGVLEKGGQASNVYEAMDLAAKFALMKSG